MLGLKLNHVSKSGHWCISVLLGLLHQVNRNSLTRFKHIFLDENVRTSIKISLKFVPKGPVNKMPVLVQIMAWCRSGDKSFSEQMVVSLLTHICVTRPYWVNIFLSHIIKLEGSNVMLHFSGTSMMLIHVRGWFTWESIAFKGNDLIN